MDAGDEREADEEMEGVNGVYLPGDPLKEDEELVHDETSYLLYHEAQTGSPCLSYDIIPDDLGFNRADFPLSCYVVCGTQSDQRPNHVIVMKMSNLHRTKEKTEDEDSESSEDEEEEDLDSKPELETAMVSHRGGVNRIRWAARTDNLRLAYASLKKISNLSHASGIRIPTSSCGDFTGLQPLFEKHFTKFGSSNIAATWSERNSVHLWDLREQLDAVSNVGAMQQFLHLHQKRAAPIYTFSGHLSEGFAMDWSTTASGTLLTGDCRHHIHLWTPQDSGSWHVDQRPYSAHTDSVEDIQWSPNERSVFASCSVDKTIRIWDTRAAPQSACMLTTRAHEKDVNVISWNKKEPFLLSGGDDGVIKVWDLRQFQKGEPIALFKHHTGPITSVEWHPTESSIFAASGADNQITQWDLAVEPDNQTVMEQENNTGMDSEQNNNAKIKDIPPQLLFIHQGQTDIKELHWHPQIPGVLISTALSGFNIFKTVSV